LGLAAAMTFPILVIVWNASRTVGILLLPYQFWLVIAAVLSMGYAIKN
jgi:benzodiazapine receptor